MRLFRILPSSTPTYAVMPLPHAPPGLQAGISLRPAGDLGRGSAARETFFRALGAPPTPHYSCRQVHSRRVLAVNRLLPGEAPAEAAAQAADGLIAGQRDCLLSVTVADCLPIFVYDRRGGAFALLHSGWKGTGIVTEAVRLLDEQYGVEPSRLVAVMGPGIGSCCYSVDHARAGLFRREFGERAVRRCPDGGRPCLDLREANAALLEAAGVREVHAAAECTACTAELFSFRRDGPGFGRMAAFIGAIQR